MILAALTAPTAMADWKAAPVIPRLDAGARTQLSITLRRGRALGNRRDVLAKVGDSISWSPAFLQPLGCGQSRLAGHRALRSTIRLFSRRPLPGKSVECAAVNSLSRASAATKPLMPSSWPLQPGGADNPACSSTETPLACEIRVVRPAYALILLGTNDVTYGNIFNADPLPEFLADMRAIVRSTRRRGVVPVLSTLPPRTDTSAETTTERLNAGLVPLADALHAPLINLWRALAPLPQAGLFDGIHLSVSGWPGCAAPCDPSFCEPSCFAANFGPAGLRYGSDRRNLITLLTLRRLAVAVPGP
jgi:hypothetical protein